MNLSFSVANVKHLPSSLAGLSTGAGWILGQISTAAGCATPLTSVKSWVPAVAIAVIGAVAGPKPKQG